MKSLFSSILTLFLTISVLVAQTDKTGLAIPVAPTQEIKQSDDANAGMKDPATIITPKSESRPKLDNAAVIRYATSAKCFVSLLDNGALVQRILCKDMQTGKRIEQVVQNQTVSHQYEPFHYFES